MNLHDRDITKTWDRFHAETWDHKMTVFHDDGLYRHLRFTNPAYGAYWFDLITSPGTLMFRGDGDSYVFARDPDMFRFFASGIGKDGTLGINPGYWTQKLTSSREAAMTYSKETVWEHLEEYYLAEWRNGTPADGRAARDIEVAWKDADNGGMLETYPDLCNWFQEHEDHLGSDWYEIPHENYDWWYLWALCGIVWGIDQYLKAGHTFPPETESGRVPDPRGRSVARLGTNVASLGTVYA